MASTPLITTRPMSTKEIAEQASAFQWNANIPMKAWLRTAHTLNKEVSMQSAWLTGYGIRVMDCLPSHPEAKTPEGRKSLASTRKPLELALSNLERIKPILQKEYEVWLSSASRRRELRQKQQVNRAKPKTPPTYEERASGDPALSATTRLLDAGEHQDLAVELAKREIHRRDANRKATRRAGVPQEEEQYRRTAGFWDNWTNELANKQAEDEELFRRQMESTRIRLDGIEGSYRDSRRDEPRPPAVVSTRNSSYRYPSISKSEPVRYDSQPAHPKQLTHQPPRPPKEEIQRQYETSPDHIPVSPAPKPPTKEPLYPEKALPTPETSQELPALPPKIHGDSPVPSKTQQRLTFKPAAYLENGEPVRPIFLPSQLRHRFLSIASENTKRGLEMCGILCGTAVNNALFVRCLLIPEQKSAPDTCETENEGAMLEYCMNEDLLMLGWIHTHPTQTCFMSSRDLHTQSGYQVMLPESIAIVCAPKFEPSYGIFRLTKPPGLEHILNCTQTATFHPHSVDNLYTKAQRPTGHVYESDKLEFYVQDLRPGARSSPMQHKSF
ncbi:hypothetical protein AAE478_009924 [Parahypoxylon ruwenzoriense]